MPNKAVIFSQWIKTIEKMEKELREEFKDTNIYVIIGGIANKDIIIQAFRDDVKDAILIASDCMAFGSNLQFADTIINIDLPWSPSVLEQRIGRLDRLGQKSPKIHILSLITVDTVDEYVYSLLKQKLKMFNSVVDGVESEEDVGSILFAVKRRVFGK